MLAGQPWLQIEDYESACISSGLIVEHNNHVGLRWFGKSWCIFLSAVPQRLQCEMNSVGNELSES
jgi:hypothetical protein